MNCPACAHQNRTGAKFCEECAAPLPRACASCGSELRPGAKFCDECGTPASGSTAAERPAEPAGARKIVTIVFADLVGSTALHERLDAESARRFMESYYVAMRGAVEAHGGTVTQLLGDGVKAVFGIPRVAEDDAIRAVRAAVAMQDAFRALAERQGAAVGKTGLRVAVNSGEVIAKDASEIIGDPVNVAARLQEQGRDGDVVIGETTQRLVETLVTLDLLGSFALKGRAEAVKAYRVVSLEPPAAAATTAFVGRDGELARITAVYQTAISTPAAKLAVLLGSPGLGKSRMIDEFARRLGESATVLTAHCDAAGGASFAPLADALRALPDLDAAMPATEADRARILGGIRGLIAGSPASPEETFFVVRRLLVALAAQKPVVLVIDDVHWAEPLLLDLIEHLVQWGTGARLLMLAGARPEMRETRSSLTAAGGLVSDVVTLSGLDAGAAMRLAANVIGATDLPAAVAAKVLATSEGNPLFVGELVRMLVHEGALKKEGDRWTAGTALAVLEMPPTIHALLAARIERLRPEELAVLERAAIIGRTFSRSAVAELLARDAGDLGARLESLRRSELIEPDPGWFLGEPALRFHHLLIRDAAYRRILKSNRAKLHARFADWVAARAPDAIEHDETLGWHLEQAHQNLLELGPLDARGQDLGARAAKHLAAAGKRALARDDVPLAAGLLGRAIARLDREDPARAELALDWCEALLASGDVAPAIAAIEELARFIADEPRLRAWHTCFVGQLTALTAPEGLAKAAEDVARAAEELAALGDTAGEAKAHFVHAQAFARLGSVGACEASLDRALAAARRAGDRRRANTVLAVAPLAALWGPGPVTRASGRCLDVVRVLRITQGAPAVEAVALSCQGVLEALRGRTDAARRMIASARKMVEELGITQRLLETDVFAARIDLLEGDAAAAERGLRGAYDGLRAIGLGIDAARAAALLARALLAQGRADEAEALSHESEVLAGDDLQAAIAWRGARAEALARRGEFRAAIEFAQAAVEIAAKTDALLDHADARLALATALRAAGRGAEADAEERRATELWEAKGATLLAERARHSATRAEEPAEARATPVPGGRRVTPNSVTTLLARFDAAIRARDLEVAQTLWSDSFEMIYHPTGSTWGRDGMLRSTRAAFGSQDPRFQEEILATLGNSLALSRRRAGAGGTNAGKFDVGPHERVDIAVTESDGHDLIVRMEVFSVDQLGEALARLYDRHAELLPEGPERARAAGISRSAGAIDGPLDRERLFATYAPDVETVDHRTVGFGTLHGRAALCDAIDAMFELTTGFSGRAEDVLGLSADALLVRHTSFGTERRSGGPFERVVFELIQFDENGRYARWERFDPEQEAEALARFDALTGGSVAPHRESRSVRPNAALASFDAASAGIHARDLAAVERELAEVLTFVHHPTGASYGRREFLATWRGAFRAESLDFRSATLATLGESLVLRWQSTAVSGLTEKALASFGPARIDELALGETDERGKTRRFEVFAPDRLGRALSCMYERYAECLPAGPARTRAEATARTIESLTDPPDLERLGACMSPAVEFIDRRMLGQPPMHGAEAVRTFLRLQFEAEDLDTRVDGILRLEPSAFLVSWTTFGTARVSGGQFERSLLHLWLFDDDGLLAHMEQFDIDREAEALARFVELTTGSAAPPPVPRSVRANSATSAGERIAAAIRARDVAALDREISDELEYAHHPTGANFGKRPFMLSWRSAFRAEQLAYRHDALATLGTSLALARESTSVAGLSEPELAPLGLAQIDDYYVVQANDRGQWQHIEIFRPSHLGDAIARLYERHAALLPEGRARARAASTARAIAAFSVPPDVETLHSVVESGIEFVDHRTLGYPPLRGIEAVREYFRVMFETERPVTRIDDVLRLEPGALLLRWTTSGTALDSGGAYDREFLKLWAFGEGGLLGRIEYFDADCEADAHARFDALFAPTPASRHANAATRATETMLVAWHARDWDGFSALLPADFRVSDRRKHVLLELEREAAIEFARSIGDMDSTLADTEVIATRGDRLSLARWRVSVSDRDVGSSEIDQLTMIETDPVGRPRALFRWDLDDTDGAWAELDARWDAGEATAHPLASGWLREFRRHFATRDWDAMKALCAPDLVATDHRLVGWDTQRGADDWVRTLQVLVELAPDVAFRIDHVQTSERSVIFDGAFVGTRDGGAFESPVISIPTVDEHGRLLHLDLYDPDKWDAARARFAESSAPERPAHPFANTASRLAENFTATFAARDWQRFTDLVPAELRFVDRSRMAQLDLDREQYFEYLRPLREARSLRVAADLVATRGDRLALVRVRTEVADGDRGPSEVASLFLFETDARGEFTGLVRFDLEDPDAAFAELDARWDAGEATAHPLASGWLRDFRRHFATRDWDALTALCAPDFVATDDQLVGWGTLRGADEWVRTLQVLVELAPDTRWRLDHVETSERAVILGAGFLGTRDGGAFESPLITVLALDETGRLLHQNLYDPGKSDLARARFAELGPPAPDAFETPATVVVNRILDAWRARDWPGLSSCLAPEFRFSDRQRLIQLELAADGYIEFIRQLGDMRSTSIEAEVLATRGNRLVLVRVLIRVSGGDVGPSEFAFVNVMESGANGDLIALVRFDADALDEAFAELDARFDPAEGAAHPRSLASMRAVHGAFSARDWNAFTNAHAPDVVCHDHRLLGWGTLHGAASSMRTQQALVELAPDAAWRDAHEVTAEHGYLVSSATLGTRDGGPFELPVLRVSEVDATGRIRRIDLYDLDRRAEALARFEELRDTANPARRFENAATRLHDRFLAAFEARDWTRLETLLAPGLRQIDRRDLMHLDLDRSQHLESLRFALDMAVSRFTTEGLATRGEWLELSRFRQVLSDGSTGPSEIEYLGLGETDASGALRTLIRFNTADLDAAHAELDARWLAGDAAAHPRASRWLNEFRRAFAARDWNGLAALHAPDQVAVNHRTVGWGTLRGAGAWVPTLQVLVDLAADTRVRVDHVRTCARGFLWQALWHGTRDGGEWETPWLMLVELDAHGRQTRLDVWDVEAYDEARARFDALCASEAPDPLRIPPNAATRAADRHHAASDAGDFESRRALTSDDFVYEDRGKRALVRGDVETWIASARYNWSLPDFRFRRELIATLGDRLALEHVIWFGGSAEAESETERLRVFEVDGAGRALAMVLFDPDDRVAALAEMQARFVAGEAAGVRAQAIVPKAHAAMARHDWKALAATMTPDFSYQDHRTLGLPALDRAGYLESLRALAGLATDFQGEEVRTLAWNEHGRAVVYLTRGTFTGSGPFERVMVSLLLCDGDLLKRIEDFEAEDVERALARFAELSAK